MLKSLNKRNNKYFRIYYLALILRIIFLYYNVIDDDNIYTYDVYLRCILGNRD